MSAHIKLARTEGAKAGFNAYMAAKTHTAAQRRAEIRAAGNKKAQFAAYCAIFGEQFGTVTGAGAVRSENQRQSVAERLGRLLNVGNGVQAFEDEDTDEAPVPAVDPLVSALAEKLGVSVEKLAELAGTTSTPVETPAPVQTERVIVAKRISFPMAMAIKKIATKQGVAFEITGKTGGEGTDKPADYTVVVDGVALSAKEASEIIANSKR